MAPFTTNHATTVRMLLKQSFPRTLFSRPAIYLSTSTKKATGTEVRAKFGSQATVDSTPSPSLWKNVMGCTTAPPMSSRWLRTLLVLAYPPSNALRPHPSRSLPAKSAESATTRSTTIASRNLRLGCSNLAPRAKTNWISYLASSLAFPPVSNTTRFASSTGKKKHTSRNKLLNILPNAPLRQWFYALLHI